MRRGPEGACRGRRSSTGCGILLVPGRGDRRAGAATARRRCSRSGPSGTSGRSRGCRSADLACAGTGRRPSPAGLPSSCSTASTRRRARRPPRPSQALAAGVPAGSTLVLAGRSLPAGPLARLRAAGSLFEVEAADLAFSPREIALLLRGLGVELSEADLSALVERTEGWPTGVYLAALAAKDGHPAAGDDRFVADYFDFEHLSGLGEADLRFLTRTSVLDTLCGSLCDAVLEDEGSARRLRALERAGLLLVPLDQQPLELPLPPRVSRVPPRAARAGRAEARPGAPPAGVGLVRGRGRRRGRHPPRPRRRRPRPARRPRREPRARRLGGGQGRRGRDLDRLVRGGRAGALPGDRPARRAGPRAPRDGPRRPSAGWQRPSARR